MTDAKNISLPNKFSKEEAVRENFQKIEYFLNNDVPKQVFSRFSVSSSATYRIPHRFDGTPKNIFILRVEGDPQATISVLRIESQVFVVNIKFSPSMDNRANVLVHFVATNQEAEQEVYPEV